MEDSAEYSVEVKNQYGEAYSFATVLVRSKYKYSFGFKLSNTAVFQIFSLFDRQTQALWKRTEQLLFLSHFWAQAKVFLSDSIWTQLSFHWDKIVLNLGAYFFWTAMKQPHSGTQQAYRESAKDQQEMAPQELSVTFSETSQCIIEENGTFFPEISNYQGEMQDFPLGFVLFLK